MTAAPTDCLLIIDVQNDFCRGGALEVPTGEEVVALEDALCSNPVSKIDREVVL